MKENSWFFVLAFIICSPCLNAQTAEEVLEKYDKAIDDLKTVSYRIHYNVSTATETVWNKTGYCYLKRLAGEPLVGFQFKAKQDGTDNEFVFYGTEHYVVNHVKRAYTSLEINKGVFGTPGGQMILKELIQKPKDYNKLSISKTDSSFILRFEFPNNAEFQMTNFFKEIHLSKKTYLPFSVHSSLDRLNRKQIVMYRLTNILINSKDFEDPFLEKEFLKIYANKMPEVVEDKSKTLVNKAAPDFKLTDFTGKSLQLSAQKNKVILLDFWEIWCGPCVASVKDLKKLAEKYPKDKFEIWSIVSDPKSFPKIKAIAESQQLNYSVLFGNKDVGEKYFLYGFPLYILVDKEGTVRYTTTSFSAGIERTIEQYIK